MPKVTANLTKDVAIANKPLMSQGMISLTADGNESALPLDLIMVLDVSGSMAGKGIQVIIESVICVQNQMGPDDRLAIITFNNSATVHSQWIDRNGTISGLTAGGGTNFGSAINKLLDFLGQHGGDSGRAGIALFMSDGHGGKAGRPRFCNTRIWLHYALFRVTSGANPDHLENMAELARGRYFDAPEFDDVKKKFEQLFKYGKTTIYSAPVLGLDIASGVKISEVMEVNGTALVTDADLGPGMHSLALCNVTQGNVSQVSFKIEVDNIKMGDNDLINIEFMGSNGTLNVKGTDVRTDLFGTKLTTL